MTNTMAVVIAVSRREGHVTFAISERTSCKNLNGLTFAMVPVDVRIRKRAPPSPDPRFEDEPTTGPCFWEHVAAEVRRRAASEARYLLRVVDKIKARFNVGSMPGAMAGVEGVQSARPVHILAHQTFLTARIETKSVSGTLPNLARSKLHARMRRSGVGDLPFAGCL